MPLSKYQWLSIGPLLLGILARGAEAQAPAATPGMTLARAMADSGPRPAATGAIDKRQATDTATKIELYGFAQADAIYDFLQNNPDWYDVNRPSRIPKFDDEFGRDHRAYVSVRQSRWGARATIPTPRGPDIKVQWEWDLFGVGKDAGLTTIRARHMWGQWGDFGAGLTNSPFMDVDVFPNILDYWGPNGMLFFRNVQVFWQPIHDANGTRATLALEQPGASGDAGVYADRIELQNIRPRFPAPDISGEYRYQRGWGYVELGGIVRWFKWDDVLADTLDLSGGTTGWGLALSSNINAGKSDVFRLMAIYGAGVENYFNDAPIDVGLKLQPGNRFTPVTGEALPDFGMSAYLDHRWNSRFTSAIGYARVDIDNSDGQAGDAFKSGQYASTNLLWSPLPNIMMGGEFQWAHRQNHFDGFSSDDYRLQFSFKYSFSQTFGGRSR